MCRSARACALLRLEDEAVCRGGTAQWAGAQLAVLDDLRMTNDDLVPAGPATVRRRRPTRFCPKSIRCAPVGVRSMRTGATSSILRTGSRVRASGITSVLDDGCWSARRGVASEVESLAGVDAGGDDLPVAGGGPRFVRSDDLAVPVGVDQVQFQRRGRLVAVDPRALRPETVLLREPAPREPDLDAMRCSAGEEGEDVDRVVQHAGVVARPAGTQHRVVDDGSVDRHLRDAEGRHVHEGADDLVADAERVREQYRLGGTRRVGEADERRRPFSDGRQPHLARRAPLREGAERVGDANFDHVWSIVRERREGPGPEDILVTLAAARPPRRPDAPVRRTGSSRPARHRRSTTHAADLSRRTAHRCGALR